MTRSLFAFAAAQDIPLGASVRGEKTVLRGVELPLPGTIPGLDHPPPGWGEGDRDRVMSGRFYSKKCR